MLHITSASHLDHGLSPDHVAWLERSINDKIASGEIGPGVSVLELVIPAGLAGLHCALYSDVPEAEALYARRGAREYVSRVVSKPKRWTRRCTAVVGPHDGQEHTLYTAYGGPAAPREPGDPSLPKACPACDDGTPALLRESIAFWSTHALATGGAPSIPESEAPNDDPSLALGHD